MSFRTRRNRGGRRRSLRGGTCSSAAAPVNSLMNASGGGKRSRRGGKRTRRAGSRKRSGGLSSQLIPWALMASVLGLSKRKSCKHKKKNNSRRR